MPADRVRLTPKVRALVAADRQWRPAVGRLTPPQTATLSAIARGADGFDEQVSVHRALSALSVGAPAEVAHSVLDEVASDRTARSTDRVAALRGLARLATPEAEAALLERARERDPRVRQAALAGLGMFATPAALRRLARMRAPGDEAVAKQLHLTRALIAHRSGLDGPFLPDVKPVARRSARKGPRAEFALQNRGAEPTRADRKILRGSTYGIELANESLELRCGKAEWTVFVNREVTGSATLVDRLFERPWIAALLARWAYGRLSLATHYLVLTRPVDDGARVQVVRSDGEVLYAGSADELSVGFGFVVADVDRPGTAPTKVVGQLGREGIALDSAIPSASRVGTRRAEAERADRPRARSRTR